MLTEFKVNDIVTLPGGVSGAWTLYGLEPNQKDTRAKVVNVNRDCVFLVVEIFGRWVKNSNQYYLRYPRINNSILLIEPPKRFYKDKTKNILYFILNHKKTTAKVQWFGTDGSGVFTYGGVTIVPLHKIRPLYKNEQYELSFKVT